MPDKITKDDDSAIADVIWFIQGWINAHTVCNVDSDSLQEYHIKALIKYKNIHDIKTKNN